MSYIAFCSSRNTHEGSENQESMKSKKRRDETSTFIQLQFIGHQAKIQISKRMLQENKISQILQKNELFLRNIWRAYIFL